MTEAWPAPVTPNPAQPSDLLFLGPPPNPPTPTPLFLPTPWSERLAH